MAITHSTSIWDESIGIMSIENVLNTRSINYLSLNMAYDPQGLSDFESIEIMAVSSHGPRIWHKGPLRGSLTYRGKNDSMQTLFNTVEGE
ncbi:hypothetical protein N7501_003008 [Penicillium viridicatum]|nr:hypothetical protein N7501_003008 [Penicillium viridicatum]